jgi:transposase-like protein
VARRRKGPYPNEFRRMAVERLKRCENIVALSEELGVHRLLYKWCDQLDRVDISAEPPPENRRESTLRKEVIQLKRLLAEKTLEMDFFKGALQKVEARRQKHGITGEKASTTKSGSNVDSRQLEYRANVSVGWG